MVTNKIGDCSKNAAKDGEEAPKNFEFGRFFDFLNLIFDISYFVLTIIFDIVSRRQLFEIENTTQGKNINEVIVKASAKHAERQELL